MLPGHQGAGDGILSCRVSMTLTVHSQVTFPAPSVRKSVTICRQAATNAFGEACPWLQEYQDPFISWPKLRMTG